MSESTLRAVATRVNAIKPDNPAVTLKDLVEVALLRYAMENIRNKDIVKVPLSKIVVQEAAFWTAKIFELVNYDSDISLDSHDEQIIKAVNSAFDLFVA